MDTTSYTIIAENTTQIPETVKLIYSIYIYSLHCKYTNLVSYLLTERVFFDIFLSTTETDHDEKTV